MSNVYVVTVATSAGGYYNCLQRSCEINNLKLITLGWDEKWKGFAWRWELYDELLKNLNDDDIIIWIDAYDVLIMDNKDIVINKFKKFNKEIVFGLDASSITDAVFRNCEKPIINGGSHIGYVRTIKKLALLMRDDELAEKWRNDDQHMLNELNCTNDFFNDEIGYDMNYDLFYVTGTSEWYRLDYLINGKLNLTDKSPAIIHGSAGMNMTRYAKELGCDLCKIKNPDIKFKMKQARDIVINAIRLNYDYIFAVLLLITIFIVWIVYRIKGKIE